MLLVFTYDHTAVNVFRVGEEGGYELSQTIDFNESVYNVAVDEGNLMIAGYQSTRLYESANGAAYVEVQKIPKGFQTAAMKDGMIVGASAGNVYVWIKEKGL